MRNIQKKITLINKSSRNGQSEDYIVLHYTGNETDTAWANANYFYSVDRQSSAHFFTDPTNIVQVVEVKDAAWSVGVNYGENNLFGKCTNYNSINIEMCSNNGKIADETVKNTIGLTKYLMAKYNIPSSRVVRHYDVCSKQCPGWAGWLPGNDKLWKAFKAAISAPSDGWTGTGSQVRYYKNGDYYAGWHKMGKAEGEKVEHFSFFDRKTGYLAKGWKMFKKGDSGNKDHHSYFGNNGWLRVGWVFFKKGDSGNKDHYSYFDSKGWLVTNQTIELKGVKYTFDSKGWLTSKPTP